VIHIYKNDRGLVLHILSQYFGLWSPLGWFSVSIVDTIFLPAEIGICFRGLGYGMVVND